MKKLLGTILVLLPIGFLFYVLGETYGYMDTLIGFFVGFGLTTAGLIGLDLIAE